MEGDARWLCCLSLLLFLFTSPHNALHSPDLVLGVGSFSSPRGVTVDPNSDALFVVDTNNNRILRFNNRSALTSGSPPDFVFGVNAFTATSTSLLTPTAAWVDLAGRLWVADTENNRVVGFQANTTQDPPTAFVQLGQNSSTTSAPNLGGGTLSAYSLRSPRGVTVEGSYLWVSDSVNNRYSLPFVL
jgi:sugar lactone lactonase YvrE